MYTLEICDSEEGLDRFYQEWRNEVHSGGRPINESYYSHLGKCGYKSTMPSIRKKAGAIALELLRYAAETIDVKELAGSWFIDLQYSSRLYELVMHTRPDGLEDVLLNILRQPNALPFLTSHALLNYLTLTGSQPDGCNEVIVKMLQSRDPRPSDGRFKRFVDCGLITPEMCVLALRNPVWLYEAESAVAIQLRGINDQYLIEGVMQILADLYGSFPTTRDHILGLLRILLLLPRSEAIDSAIAGHLRAVLEKARENTQLHQSIEEEIYAYMIKFGEFDVPYDRMSPWDAMEACCRRQGYSWQDVAAKFIDEGVLETTSDILNEVASGHPSDDSYFARLLFLFQFSGYHGFGTSARDEEPDEVLKCILEDVRPRIEYTNLSSIYARDWRSGDYQQVELVRIMDDGGSEIVTIETGSLQFVSLLEKVVVLVVFEYAGKVYCIPIEEYFDWMMAWRIHDAFNAFMEHIGNDTRSFYLFYPDVKTGFINICADAAVFTKLAETLRLPVLLREPIDEDAKTCEWKYDRNFQSQGLSEYYGIEDIQFRVSILKGRNSS
jgi:hypothetical protein